MAFRSVHKRVTYYFVKRKQNGRMNFVLSHVQLYMSTCTETEKKNLFRTINRFNNITVMVLILLR